MPLVVLAGCHTALAGAAKGGPAAAKAKPALPSLATELLDHGVPAVLAMQAPVGDRYASLLASHLYQALASHQNTDPLAALWFARSTVEKQRRDELREATEHRSSRSEDLAQWATPALYLRGAPHPLFHSDQPFDKVMSPPEPDHDPVVVVRRVGEFVGRRQVLREERAWLQGRDGSALVLHGMGGVGKSTLAAEMARFFAEQRWVVASLSGQVNGETLLQTVASRVRMALLTGVVHAQRDPEPLLKHLENRELTWIERLEGLRALGAKVLLLLDNFEDNLSLGQELRNAAKLGAAQRNGGAAGTLGTPAGAVGTQAGTLATQAGAQGTRAVGAVGVETGPSISTPSEQGSRVIPEALEELLAAWVAKPGSSRLLITSRYPIELPEGASRGASHQLRHHHLGPLTQAETRKLLWRLEALDRLSQAEQRRAYAEVGGHPRALEYLDALLRQGRARFPDVEKRLIADLKKKHGIDDPARWCAARTASFDTAQAELITLAAQDVLLPELLGRLADAPLAKRLLIGAAVYRHPVEAKALWWQLTETQGDPVTETQEPEPVAQATNTPPGPDLATLEAPEGFASARERLEALSLLCPVPGEPPTPPNWFVHRWTASALRGLAPKAGWTDAEWTLAHARAAEYFHWRVHHLPQPKAQDVEDLLEARFHDQARGSLAAAVGATLTACIQLDTWGAWQREQDLYLESLGWVAQGSRDAAVFQHNLGRVAQERGDYDAALDWYKRSLAIFEELGDRSGMAASYHNLGIIAQERGDYDAALDWYQKSLAIEEELGNRSGMASSYHHLGWVAQDRGDYDRALDWYQRSLAIEEELGNRSGMASSYHQLGIVAQNRGDYDGALEWYKRSLAIKEELGNRSGMASSYGQLGALLTEQGRVEEAIPLNLQSLAIHQELGVPQVSINVLWLARQREALGEARFNAVLAQHLDAESVKNVLELLEREGGSS